MGLLVFGFDVGGGSVVNQFFVSIFYIKKKQTVDDVVHYWYWAAIFLREVLPASNVWNDISQRIPWQPFQYF